VHKVTLVAAIQAAGFSVENPSSPNVVQAVRGAKRVYAMPSNRGWRLQNMLRYPTRQGVFRQPEQVTEFCRSLVEPAPIFFDGEQSIRLDHVGAL
jgi:hypothetical protein